MKRLFLIAVLTLFVGAMGFAQKANVNRAKNKALAVENPDFQGAKDDIEEALQNDETKNLANTLYVAGLVYEKSADNEFIKVQTGMGDEETMGRDALKAVEYYLKAIDLDQMPDAKGKVKPKFTKKIKTSLKSIYNKMMLVNYGVKKYNEHSWSDAINAFETHTEILDLPVFVGEKNMPEKDSTYYDIKFYAAESAWAGEMNQTAIEMYRKLKETGYKANKTLQILSQLYQAEKDTVNYVASLHEGVEQFPEEFYFLGNLINHYVYGGQPEKASELLNKAIENDPNNPQLYSVLGSMLELKEDYEGAMTNYDKALELNPELADAWVNKGRLIYNKAFKAEGEANSISDIKLLDIELEKVNAIYKESIPFFEKALDLNPEDYETMKILRGLYYKFSEEKAYQQKYDEIVKRING